METPTTKQTIGFPTHISSLHKDHKRLLIRFVIAPLALVLFIIIATTIKPN